MQTIPQNYKVPEVEFEKFDDGIYKIKGIRWYSLDERERPILVAQKDGRLVGRAYVILEDDSDGPPYSLELGQMSLLVKAFGGDPSKLPHVPEISAAGKITKYMEKVQTEAVGNIITAEVVDGWVKSLEGMVIPTGLYYYKLENFSPVNEDGEPEPKEGEYGKYFFVHSKIIAGEGGAETPWKDAVVRDFLNYAIDVEETEDGPIPTWKKSKTGAFTAASTTLAHFMQYTAPALFEEGYAHSDPYNLLPDWLEEAKKSSMSYKGYRVKSKDGKYVNMNWATLEPISDFEENILPWENSNSEKQQRTEEKAREALIAFMNVLAKGDAFSNIGTLALSTEGKQAAKIYLTPLKQKGILTTGTLSKLNFDDVMNVLSNVEIEDEKLKEAVTEIRHNLAAAGIGVNDDGDF